MSLRRIVFISLSLVVFAGPVVYPAAPTAATITSPSNASGATYNTRPWIMFNGTIAADTINDVKIEIDGTSAAFGNIVYSRTNSAGYQAEFFGMNPTAASGATIRHRVDTALAVGNKWVRVSLWGTTDPTRGPTVSATVQFNILAPSWTDAGLNPSATLVKATHLTELMTAINNVRQFRGIGTTSFGTSPAAGGAPLASQLNDLRNGLKAAYTVGAVLYTGSNPAYTAPDPMTAGNVIRTIHIQELRNEVMYP